MSEIALPKTDTKVAVEILEKALETSNLIIHNDEVNTFDHVIDSLIEICGMPVEQAEQCTILIHYKGKYGVKQGSKDELRPLKDAFIDRGISATIE